jgi:hypothetical protein
MPAFINARSLIMSTAPTPSRVPTLDFNFLSGALDSRITFTRASAGWAFDSSGTLASHATNTPRFDHDPVTLAPKGLLSEEARTNSLRVTDPRTGSAAGTPGTLPTNWTELLAGGISRTVVGNGIQNGIPYVDVRWSGTATGTSYIYFDTTSFVVASTGQVWAGSAYVALVAGALTNVTTQLSIREALSAGTLVREGYTVFVPTATLVSSRPVRASTLGATTERIVLRLNIVSTGAIDLTLRIGIPQLELGAAASSPILSTGAAVTRSVDLPVVAEMPWFNPSAGTVVAEFMLSSVLSATQTVVSIDDATSNERHTLRSASGGATGSSVADGGVSQAVVGSGTLVASTAYKFGYAFAANDFAACTNGGTVSTDSSGTLPTVTRMTLGYRLTSSESLNGHIRRVRYWTARLANPTLVRITA